MVPLPGFTSDRESRVNDKQTEIKKRDERAKKRARKKDEKERQVKSAVSEEEESNTETQEQEGDTGAQKQERKKKRKEAVPNESEQSSLSAAKHDENYESQITLTAFNVGQGNCILVEDKNKPQEAVLVDCGSKESNDDRRAESGKPLINKPTTIDDIRKRLVDKKVSVIITHYHDDHYNWLPEILNEAITPAKVLIADSQGLVKKDLESSKNSNFINWLANKDYIILDNEFMVDRKISTVLEDWPITTITGAIAAESSSTNPNADSIVFKITAPGSNCSAILPGDATGATTTKAIKNKDEEELYTTVLFSSHHGSNTERSNAEEWIEHTYPQAIIISSGDRRDYALPKREILNRYINNLPDRLAKVNMHELSAFNKRGGSPQSITEDTTSPPDSKDEMAFGEVAIFSTYDQGTLVTELGKDTFSITSIIGMQQTELLKNEKCLPLTK